MVGFIFLALIGGFIGGYIIGGEEKYSAGYSAGMMTATAGMHETQRQAVQRVENERRKVSGWQAEGDRGGEGVRIRRGG